MPFTIRLTNINNHIFIYRDKTFKKSRNGKRKDKRRSRR